MALGNEFPYVSTGNLYTAIDTYASTISTQPPINTPSNPNGALNPAGAAFLLSQGSLEGPTVAYAGKGFGAPLIVRYVRYNSTANPNLLAYPAPVYWTDETFTTVSGVFSEGNPAATGNLNSLAGILLPNYTSLGLAAAAAATALNGNWCFIVTRGWVPNVSVPASTAIGDALVGTSGNFTFARVASGTAPTSRFNCTAQTAISASNTADVLVNTDITF